MYACKYTHNTYTTGQIPGWKLEYDTKSSDEKLNSKITYVALPGHELYDGWSLQVHTYKHAYMYVFTSHAFSCIHTYMYFFIHTYLPGHELYDGWSLQVHTYTHAYMYVFTSHAYMFFFHTYIPSWT
jgi:hypothetical protein